MELRIYLVLLMVIIICGGVIWRVIKRLKWDVKFHRDQNNKLNEANYQLRDSIKSKESIIKKMRLSALNLQNAINYKQPEDFNRHVFICNLNEGQQVVIIFDEELEYSQELQQKFIDRDRSPLKHSREIECVVFVDGEKEQPLLMKHVFGGSNNAEIEDINCGKFTNRGIGTYILQNLFIVLKGMGIETVKASLSTVDYHKKDKLYNFYLEKNGFNLIRELTEDKWGLVSKKLNV
ncbi:hypothetical protein E2R58_22795 [Paenibacillus amylolyticus]|uniref:hypothetical protein n=1 Tax=Paenibacillus TaxID=44249 RepID=UPI001059EE00|nr:hypothetical protein [Paenibacillus amylolyticus]TDL64480.1 hypothetical protein E2R58_22795 [Paenibacillus amylolyticus]